MKKYFFIGFFVFWAIVATHTAYAATPLITTYGPSTVVAGDAAYVAGSNFEIDTSVPGYAKTPSIILTNASGTTFTISLSTYAASRLDFYVPASTPAGTYQMQVQQPSGTLSAQVPLTVLAASPNTPALTVTGATITYQNNPTPYTITLPYSIEFPISVGDTLTIKGTNFDSSTIVVAGVGGFYSVSDVKFTIQPTLISSTSLSFTIPSTMTGIRWLNFYVARGAGGFPRFPVSGPAVSFNVNSSPIAPTITSINPTTVQAGGTVSVTGTGLNPVYDLQIDGDPMLMISATSPVAYPTSASFIIPANVAAGTHSVRLAHSVASNLPSSNSVSLTVTAPGGGGPGGPVTPPPTTTGPMTTAIPSITSISPTSGLAGRIVDLYGTALDNVGIVVLDGDKTKATMPSNGNSSGLNLPNSATHLNLAVPFGTPGVHTIQLSRANPMSWDGSLTLSNSVPFTILRETLNSVSPTSLRACDVLTLYGANYDRSTFAAFDGDVTTYKLKVPVEVAPDGTSEKVRIPGLTPGVHTVQVKYGGGTWSASSMSKAVSFTVTPGGCAVDFFSNVPPPTTSGGGADTTPGATVVPPASGGNNTNIPPSNSSNNQNYTNNNNRGYDFGIVTLFRGSRGDAVKELQRFFNDRLGLNLVMDGKFGKKTDAIVRQWQRDHGLNADGRFGAKSRAEALK